MSMTVTSAHAGMTATRLRRGLVATAAAVLTVVGMLLPAPASAATPDPTPSPSATLSGEVSMTLAPLGNGVVRAGEAISATLSVENGTPAPIPSATAVMSLADGPLSDAAALEDWLAGSGALPSGSPVATADVAAVASGETEGASFFVAATDPVLAERAPGVYPLWVDLAGRSARSLLVVPTASTASVGVVVPITAGPQQRALLSAEALETLTGADGDLSAQLDAVAGTSAILAIDPAVAVSIRVLGERAPESAVSWLERLEGLPNSRFALQFGDADVSPQLAAGLAAPLQPTSFAWALNAEDFPQPTPTPEATAEPVPSVPDDAALLDIGTTAATVYWPSAGSTTPGAVAGLSGAGTGALTLIPSDAAVDATAQHVPARGTSAEGGEVLVYDGRISRALRDAASEADASRRGAALATASGYLSFATSAAGGTPLLVAVERGAAATRAGLRAAITAVTGADGVSGIDLGGLIAAPAAAVTLADGAPSPDRAAAVSTLLGDEDRVARFATILTDPALLTGRQRALTLQLLGVGWTLQQTAWQEAMAAHAEGTAQTLDAVSIVPPTSINLLTAGTNLKFWVHNALPYPATVILSASPDDLRLTIDRETTVAVAAAGATGPSNTPVEIPVRARIANGEVRISLSLHSPTLEPIGTDQVVDVNVRADWENVGLVLMVVLVGGFLTIGIIRTIRRRRAHAATDETEHVEEAPHADAADASAEDER